MGKGVCFADDEFEMPEFQRKPTAVTYVALSDIAPDDVLLRIDIAPWKTRVLVEFGETRPGLITVQHFALSGRSGDKTMAHGRKPHRDWYCFDAHDGKEQFLLADTKLFTGDTIIRLPYEAYGRVVLTSHVSHREIKIFDRPKTKDAIHERALWISAPEVGEGKRPGIVVAGSYVNGGHVWARNVAIAGRYRVLENGTLDFFNSWLVGRTEFGADTGGHVMARINRRVEDPELVLSRDLTRIAVTGDIRAWAYRQQMSVELDDDWGWPADAAAPVALSDTHVPDYFFLNGWGGGMSLG